MRTLAITLATLLMAAAAFAQMPNLKGPDIPKLEVKIPDVPKLATEDTFLDATLVEEDGNFFLDINLILVGDYAPNELHVWVYEGAEVTSPSQSLVSIPRAFKQPDLDSNSIRVPLTRAPEVGYIKTSLVRVQDGVSGPTGVEKVYEIYCTGVQVKN